MEKEMVIAMLTLLMGSRNDRHLKGFTEFLTASNEHDRITCDTWCSYLAFTNEVPEGCEGYDEDQGAWPVVIDEYVAWVRNGKKF